MALSPAFIEDVRAGSSLRLAFCRLTLNLPLEDHAMGWRCVSIGAIVLVFSVGCRSYQRRPLELREYARQWSARPLDLKSIQSYAASLADPTAPGMFDSSDGLSLPEAEAVALHFNPQLRLARAVAGIPLASAREAGWWPDPQFEAEVLRFVNRGDRAGYKLSGPTIDGVNAGGLEATPIGLRRKEGNYIDDPWIVGAGLNITIPISGRVAAEKDLRWSQYSAAWRQILVKEWELRTELRGAWLTWSTSQERLAIAREYIGQLETIARMAGQLLAAGEMKPTESRLLQIELAHREADILAFEREEEQHRLALLALMGLAPESPVVLQPALTLNSPAPEAGNSTDELVKRHPRILSAEAEYESAERQLRLEIRRQYPDLDIGPSYSLEEGFTRFGLGFGLAIPLWNRNRQAVAEAFAAREAARVQAEAVVEAAVASLAEVEMRLKYASRYRASLLENVAPLVERQIEDGRTLLDLGEVDVLLLRDALIGSLETKLELLQARLAEELARNELNQMLRPQWFTLPQAEGEENK
ncbi:MAG: TolC family protein [Phycisphaerae bacterium]|nr:TolC family protein [Phycisphaerae bacterium]